MAETNKRSLGELMYETVDGFLEDKGYDSIKSEKRWDTVVAEQTPEVKALLETAYEIGFKDALARITYNGSDVYNHNSNFAKRLRDRVEGNLQNRTGNRVGNINEMVRQDEKGQENLGPGDHIHTEIGRPPE